MSNFTPADSSMGWPTRAEVDRIWAALASGEIDRESVHRWTRSWVEGVPGHDGVEGGVDTALHFLHGYNLRQGDSPDEESIRRGGSGPYSASLEDIGNELLRWRESYEEFLRDPEAWKAKRRQRYNELRFET